MSETLPVVVGKLDCTSRPEASALSAESHRLHVRDRDLGVNFLIDTGADLSLIPADKAAKKLATGLKLFAANEMSIETCGE